MSLPPPSGVMKPKPLLSMNFETVPVGIALAFPVVTEVSIWPNAAEPSRGVTFRL
jgi:hypothetical protein